MDTSRIYAHSGNQLFLVDNVTLEPTKVADITGIPASGSGNPPSLTDIAIDKDDKMIGVTLDTMYEINASTGVATLIMKTNTMGLTALSFVPNPDPSMADLLITANSDGDVLKIDRTTGTASMVGNYGMQGGQQIRSSGDIVGIANYGIFATVDIGDNNDAVDWLAKIDPTNNYKATPLPNSTGYNRIFGLGFWRGKFYGFVAAKNATDGGTIIEIDPVTGVGSEPLTGTIQWFGAGVATDAPILQ